MLVESESKSLDSGRSGSKSTRGDGRTSPTMMRTRLAWGAAACLFATLLLCGCMSMKERRTSLPLGPSPTVMPNAGPGVAANGETAAEAAGRLFPQGLRQALEAAESAGERRVLEGTAAGEPVPVSRCYGIPTRTLVKWVLPRDVHSVSGNMFAAMWPSAMMDKAFVVPMVKDGRAVSEFWVYLTRKGQWKVDEGAIGPVPGGSVRDLQLATERLRRVLGTQARVRPVVFVPSGLVFAVGDNNGREAAVYLAFVNWGKGVKGFHKGLPHTGELFTPAELKRLLTPRDAQK